MVWKDEKLIALVAKQTTRVPFPCAEEEIVGGSWEVEGMPSVCVRACSSHSEAGMRIGYMQTVQTENAELGGEAEAVGRRLSLAFITHSSCRRRIFSIKRRLMLKLTWYPDWLVGTSSFGIFRSHEEICPLLPKYQASDWLGTGLAGSKWTVDNQPNSNFMLDNFVHCEAQEAGWGETCLWSQLSGGWGRSIMCPKSAEAVE